MSESPSRRPGHRPAGAPARRVPAEAHEGTPRDFLRRHESEAREAVGNRELWRKLLPRLLRRIADPRNLKMAIDHIAANGDRWLRGLDPDERWEFARVLGRAIRSGRCRPGPGRTRKEPKASGKGYRTLTIPDSADRVVERAVVQVIQSILDPLFLDTSLGYRPNRGRLDALALVRHLARRKGLWVWIAEDLKDAFDLVPQRRLIDVLRHHLPAEPVVRLVERFVVTESGKGLKQGGPLSALLLNLYLHHLLDKPWREYLPDVPLVRVADDLLVLCRTEQEASEAYAALKRLVGSAGMRLKGTPESSIRNLSTGRTVGWLGYGLRTIDNRLQADLTERMWRQLERKVRECHEKPDPPVRAVEAIRGWAGQLGPLYPTSDTTQVYAEVTRIAVTHGFEELPCYEEFLGWWEDAHDRWERRCRRAGAADGDRRLPRGSARAEASRADSGPLPGGPPERGAPPGTSSPNVYWLMTAGSRPVDGGRGEWAYFVSAADGTGAQVREGSSPHTTRERMELLAVLRGLEAVPADTPVRLLVADERVAAGIAHVCRAAETGETAASGEPDGPAADLWARLRAALAEREAAVASATEVPTRVSPSAMAPAAGMVREPAITDTNFNRNEGGRS